MLRSKLVPMILAFIMIFCISNSTATAQKTQSDTVEIAIVPGASNPNTARPYEPSPYEVRYLPSGNTVKWINNDNGNFHTVTSFNNVFDSGVLPSGEFFVYTFLDRGYYNYYCQFHPYMNGVIIIS